MRQAALHALCLVLLCLTGARATTLTGTLPAPDDTTGATGTLYLSLSEPARLSNDCGGSPNAGVSTQVVSIAVVLGALQTSTLIYGNDCLIPGGTYYNVRLVDAANKTWENRWRITGTTFDVSQQVLGNPGVGIISMPGGDQVISQPPGTNLVVDNLKVTRNYSGVGGGTPGGSTTQYEYNNAGVHAGSDMLSRDGTNRRNVMNLANQQFNSATPTVPITAALTAGAGMDPGTHTYVFTCIFGGRESFHSAISNTITTAGGNSRISLTVPLCPAGSSARRPYRSYSNDVIGEWFLASSLVSALANNSVTAVTDSSDDSTLTDDAPLWDQTAGTIYVDSTALMAIGPQGIAFGNLITELAAPATCCDGIKSFLYNKWLVTDPLERSIDGFRNEPTVNVTTASLDAFKGLYGIVNAPFVYGPGTMPLVFGINNNPQVIEGATTTLVRGMSSIPTLNASTVTDMEGIFLGFAVHGGATVANQYALYIEHIDQASVINEAIHTEGAGLINYGDVDKHVNSAGNPLSRACASAIYGTTYFNTTDKRLCVCAADGTDDAWVKSSDYAHATGHCTP